MPTSNQVGACGLCCVHQGVEVLLLRHVTSLHCSISQPPIQPGEPFGKAGGYGIQGLAGSFVRRIDGCFYNVVGFPVNEFSKQLLRLIDEGHMPLNE